MLHHTNPRESAHTQTGLSQKKGLESDESVTIEQNTIPVAAGWRRGDGGGGVGSGACVGVGCPGPPPPGVADAPTGLTAEATRDTVTLSWDDPGDGTVTGYVILRRDKATQPAGTFSTVTADTGTTDTVYVDAYVERGRRYVYRVQAVNPAGVSERSRWARGYTPLRLFSSERPAKPRGLAAETTHDTVTLSWDDPGDDTVTGYAILRRDKDTHDKGVFATLVPDTGTSDTTYTDATARPDRRYVYRVKAINTAGHSTTAWTRGWTPPAPPADTADPPADDGTTANDTGTGDTETADATSTTHSPPSEPPSWVRGFVTSRAHSSSHPGSGGLGTPTRLRIEPPPSFEPGLSPPSTVVLRWDAVTDADEYNFYIFAKRTIGGVDRDWWVMPEDDGDDITAFDVRINGGEASVILGGFFRSDSPSFADGYLIIAVEATNSAGTQWSDWRATVLNYQEEALSYDIYGEDLYSDD
ncbi:fibronectin type III domain-containing protein [Candidatus Poriferisodalis sp.]|uniref:fibronectin type III domain-containing protein n=1 Tax=Candidatus Poriferisodalis sp. TaxID=3101277 RepID=UPI003B5A2360